MTNNKEISFWELLKKNKIVIPIIQRDYAQGRVGKEFLRNSFLTNLKDALDGKFPKREHNLKLDFVYGAQEGTALKPLDGQQRITTLWLLHWFIAYKSDNIKNEEVRNILLKFSYETRNSSRDFCENLIKNGSKLPPSDLEKIKTINVLKEGEEITDEIKNHLTEDEIKIIKDPSKDNFIKGPWFYKKKDEILRPYFVSSMIQNQTWFFSGWKQDPTVQGMLRMLGGSYSPLGDGSDLIDGLEEIFIESTPDKYKNYWNKLTDTENPAIVFYHLPMHDFGLADDLYIKMNARGKPLSDFENFKADLIGYINDKANNDIENPQEWENLGLTLPKKIDTNWTDIFWPGSKINEIDASLSEEKKEILLRVDERFHIFINRIFWDHLFMAKIETKNQNLKENNQKNEKKENYILNLGDKYKRNNSFEYFNTEIIDKDLYDNIKPNSYKGLSPYKFITVNKKEGEGKDSSAVQETNYIPIKIFNSLIIILDWYYNLSKEDRIDFEKILNEVNFNFIPQLQLNAKSSNSNNQEVEYNKNSMSYIRRIIFHTVCKFILESKEDEFEIQTFRKWMRVIFNLISGMDAEGLDQIRNDVAVRTAIEFIDSLESHSVYESLSKLGGDYNSPNSAFQSRIKEEIEKAKKILSDTTGEWETKIINAEKWGFFNGSIRFLFYDEKGEPNDWENFDNKFENVCKIFKKNKSNPSESCLVDEFNNATLLKRLFHLILNEGENTEFDIKTIMWRPIFNNKPSSWSYYLLNKELAKSIRNFLLNPLNTFLHTDIMPKDFSCMHDEDLSLLNQLANSKILNHFIEEKKLKKDVKLRKHYDNYEFYIPYSIDENICLIENRTKFLNSSLEGLKVLNSGKKIRGDKGEFIYIGESIEFEYKDKKFRWEIDGKIRSLNSQETVNTKDKSKDEIKEELERFL